jgi:hypothetical protein
MIMLEVPVMIFDNEDTEDFVVDTTSTDFKVMKRFININNIQYIDDTSDDRCAVATLDETMMVNYPAKVLAGQINQSGFVKIFTPNVNKN